MTAQEIIPPVILSEAAATITTENFDQPDWFDEEAYLLANPDVGISVAATEFASAYHHYVLHGRKEGRPLFGSSPERRNCPGSLSPGRRKCRFDLRCPIFR